MITVLWVFEVKQVNVQFYTWLCVHECFINNNNNNNNNNNA